MSEFWDKDELLDGDDAFEDEIDELTGSEAVYGFAGWLTSRKQQTVMSATDDAAPIASLVDEFCRANKLAEPRDGWHKRLVHPNDQ